MEKTVFISYSSKDAQFIQNIITLLKKMGISYWKAPEMIPAGSNYAREIPNAIRDCSVFLLVLSASSQTSIWVEKEVDSAICNRKTIVPFHIDQSPLSEMYRFYLNNVQMIEYGTNAKLAQQQLRIKLKELIFEDTKQDELLEKSRLFTYEEEWKSEAKQKRRGTVGFFEERKSQRSRPEDTLIHPRTKPKNDMTTNRIPIDCRFCGGEIEKISSGTYRCLQCGQHNFDYYQTVRNYLDREGPKNALMIEKNTGVPRRVTDELLRKEYLEIFKGEVFRLSCKQCGNPIRTGELCELCKKKLRG